MGRRHNFDDMEVFFTLAHEPDKIYTLEEFMPVWENHLRSKGRLIEDDSREESLAGNA